MSLPEACSLPYRTLAENAEAVDAVIVATPPITLPEIAMYFMRRGIHVLCEKPLCLSVTDAKQMIETAEKSGVTFTMATKFRYCADVVKAVQHAHAAEEQAETMLTGQAQRIQNYPELAQRIQAMQEMQRTLQQLIHCCHGDDRPDCPIIATLADESAMAAAAMIGDNNRPNTG